jgi:GTP-binding protein EngB required for normal cell division
MASELRVAARADPLVDYRRRKLELAELIRSTMTVSGERHDDERQASGRELLARLAEDRFELAVVGQFSRGKSTLMNALLGGPYLPTGTLPMTSVVTSVRYGSRARVFVHRAGGHLPIETSLADLDRFVAQSSSEREALRVVSVDVEVPAEILRLGFSFVDTPGVGSAIRENTAATTQFLPHADAVIFVTSVDAALSEAELAFLAHVRRYVEKLFVVVNKADLVSTAEAERVVEWVQRQLGRPAVGVDAHVFVTAATDALAYTLAGDSRGLAASGVPALNQALVAFLAGERARVFLRQTSNRASRLLARQQQDLKLGRAAQAEFGSSEVAVERLNDALATIGAHVNACTRMLLDTLEARALPELARRSQSWPTDLAGAVATRLEGLFPASMSRLSRDQAAELLMRARSVVDELLRDWLDRQSGELRSLLIDITGDELEQLLALAHFVPSVALRTLNVTDDAYAEQTAGLRAAELAPPDTPTISFEALDVDRWSGLAPLRGVPRRRLLDGAQRGVAAYAVDARDALAQTARAWAQELGRRVERDLRDDAARVRERLRAPGSDAHCALLARNAQRLREFHDALVDWHPVALERAAPPSSAAPPAPGLATGCAVCQEISSVAFDYLAEQQYRLATQPDTRVDHAASGGFCTLHTWLYAQIAEPVGTALTYAQLAECAADALREAAHSRASEQELADVLAHLLPGRDRCRVCRALGDSEQRALRRVARALAQYPSVAMPSLCVPHLAGVLAAHPGSDAGRALVSALAETLDRASEDMRTFALKRQSLRRRLLSDEEHAAYQQIIPRFAGCRELARPWRTDADDRLP